MLITNENRRFARMPLAVLVSAMLSPAAFGVSFEAGDFEFTVDSNLSVGSTWRVGDADQGNIGSSNGGQGASTTPDDGNLNYQSGDAVSQVFKGIHDIGVTKDQFGAFVRFKYWYDYALAENDVPHGHGPNNYQPNAPLNDDAFSDYGQASGIELLDAFIYGEFELGDMPLDLRVGRQVLSWGENTFIFNSINSVNPIDVTALRRPGSEVKEALLPVGMVYANLGLTDYLSVEAFYNWEWDDFKIDGCGTFFSGADVIGGDGCTILTLNVNGDQTDVATGAYATRALNLESDGDDSGQWGAALRYFAEGIDTDFGLYYMNITSRTPILSPVFWKQVPGTAPIPTGGPQYIAEFVPDQQIIAASFSTTISDWSLSGEWSFRPDSAVQFNPSEMLAALFTPTMPVGPYQPVNEAIARLGAGDLTVLGEKFDGYQELDVHQIQFTTVKFFDQVMGASRLTLVAEAAMNIVNDLPDISEARFGRSTLYGKCSTVADQIGMGNPNPDGDINCGGFVTDTSWGYRARLVWDYSDAFAGINLKPTIAWNHDVDGTSPNSNFLEDRRSFGVSLAADYLSRYNGSISYTNSIGGDYNSLSDRDYVSLSLGMSF